MNLYPAGKSRKEEREGGIVMKKWFIVAVLFSLAAAPLWAPAAEPVRGGRW